MSDLTNTLAYFTGASISSVKRFLNAGLSVILISETPEKIQGIFTMITNSPGQPSLTFV